MSPCFYVMTPSIWFVIKLHVSLLPTRSGIRALITIGKQAKHRPAMSLV